MGALCLGALAPWWTKLLTAPEFQSAQEAVGLLAFAGVVYAGYTVLAIGSGRARRTQLNWIVTGAGAAANIALKYNEAQTIGLGALIASGLVLFIITLIVNMTARLIIARRKEFSGADA